MIIELNEKYYSGKEGIKNNLLSGFYEKVAKDKKDESLRAIFQVLREEFEEAKRQGAVAELSEWRDKLFVAMPSGDIHAWDLVKLIQGFLKAMDKRIKDLEKLSKGRAK